MRSGMNANASLGASLPELRRRCIEKFKFGACSVSRERSEGTPNARTNTPNLHA